MDHKIRLGPIAVFLAVIAAVVATLAILTFATSRADVALAERFASVTATQYALDKEGGRFLQALPNGNALTGDVSELDGGGWKYYTEQDGYALTVEVIPAEEAAAAGSDTENEEAVSDVDTDTEKNAADPEAVRSWRIRKWKINKLWEGDDPFEDLWLG